MMTAAYAVESLGSMAITNTSAAFGELQAAAVAAARGNAPLAITAGACGSSARSF
jgi:hypothetical protein